MNWRGGIIQGEVAAEVNRLLLTRNFSGML